MRYSGFLTWWLGTPREWIRNPYFWCAITIWTGIGMSFFEAAASGKVIIFGTVVFAIVLATDWVRFSYKVYRIEQKQIEDRLRRPE